MFSIFFGCYIIYSLEFFYMVDILKCLKIEWFVLIYWKLGYRCYIKCEYVIKFEVKNGKMVILIGVLKGFN